MSTIAKLLAKLELDTTGFQKGLKGVPGMLNSVGGNLSQIGGSLTRGVTLPLLAAGAATIALSAKALKVGADFEKAMSGVGAIVGATDAQIKQLSDTAVKLGMDPNLIVSASEAAGVMEELAKNGLTAQQIMGGAAEGAIALANATGTDFATAAQIASTSMALFNIQAGDMSRVVDQVTAVANTSRFTAEDFALAVGMGGAAAKSAGVDFEEFTAVIASLSTVTTSGSDAGTSFKTFLTRLVPATDKAAGAMADLGMITEEGQNRFFDAEGQLRSMAEVAGVLQETLSGLSEEQRISALHTIFGTDASRAAIGLMQTGEQGFQDLMTTMAKTDAAKNAATRMDNLAGATEILGGIVEGFQIKFTQAFGPGLRSAVEAFSGFLSKNSGRIEGIFASLSGMIGLFSTDISNWLDKNGSMVLQTIEKFISAMPAIIAKLSEVGTKLIPIIDKVFNAFMEMDPDTIVTIIQAIGGLAVLGPVLVVLGSVITTIASIASLLGGLGSVIGTLVGWFGTAATAIGGFIAGGVLLPILVIIGTVALLYLAFKNNFMGIQTTAEQLGFIIKFYFEKMAGWILDNTKIAGDYVTTKFNGIMTTVKQLGSIFDFVSFSIRAAITKMIIKIGELAKKLLTLDLPDWLMPGSPTPFEIGLLGIASAMGKVNRTGLPVLENLATPTMPAYASAAAGNVPDASSSYPAAQGKTIIVNITNPKKETSEESIKKTMNRLSYLRVLE